MNEWLFNSGHAKYTRTFYHLNIKLASISWVNSIRSIFHYSWLDYHFMAWYGNSLRNNVLTQLNFRTIELYRIKNIDYVRRYGSDAK